MHGVRRQLLIEQAESLGVPIRFIVIPHVNEPVCPMSHDRPGTAFPPNDVYTPTMLAAFQELKQDGIETIIFGDIYLEDLRAFRDGLLDQSGLEGCYPLWGRDSEELYNEFHELGFRGVTVCVDMQRLSPDHCGQMLTPSFRSSLPDDVDACGERGEYHTFTFDGPLFAQPVGFRLGEIHRHGPFAFQELYSVGRAG
jgi:diphthamide synthase (EF-2-diphthine--ammonia ligase)